MFANLSVCAYGGADQKTFTYALPEGMKVQVGSLVVVNFARKPSLAVVRSTQATTPKTKFKILPVKQMLDAPPLPRSLLELADWMISYYATSSRSVWRTLLPSGLAAKTRLSVPTDRTKAQPLHKLSTEQTRAYKQIVAATQPVLLQGVTGSGKTEIYLQLIQDTLGSGKSAIFLLPEILLTEHMIGRVQRYFPTQIVVTHSGLTPGVRKALWQSILTRSSSEPLLVIGARSALFAPLQNLGLIVVDEEHEPSYKQESAPHYHAREVAARLAALSGAKLVLGSATPSMQARFLSDQAKIQRVILPTRHHAGLPTVEIVDLRDQTDTLSSTLIKAMTLHLSRGNQVLLFLNRRGSASKYLCDHCGYVFVCPGCGSGLHFHADTMQLACHICAYHQPTPATCPECQQTSLRLLGTGTKKVEQLVKALFPKARTLRIDRDSFTAKDLGEVSKQLNDQVDIIIGTQMIGRGLDLPKLQLVGIINADTELGIADYSSSERAFALITQAAGRAGRRAEVGEVIIQSYRPDNPALRDIAAHDYEAFYQLELGLRQSFTYPPYGYLLKLSCGFAKAANAQQKAEQLAESLKTKKLSVLGPVPSYPPRVANKYRYQLIVKSRKRAELRQVVAELPGGWSAELDPLTLN